MAYAENPMGTMPSDSQASSTDQGTQSANPPFTITCGNKSYNVVIMDNINAKWGPENTKVDVLDPNDGKSNTETIVKKLGLSGNYAAQQCYNYAPDNSWFLPAKKQLACFIAQHPQQDTTHIYWSSTEDDQNFAWGQTTNKDSNQCNQDPIHKSNNITPIVCFQEKS